MRGREVTLNSITIPPFMTEQESTILAERLRAGALAPDEALTGAIGLADAMRRTHHSERASVTPERIRMSARGVEIAEEGACYAGPYSSPEEWAGEAPDARSDVFAFGAIFYEMLTGRRAFAGESAEEVRQAVAECEPAPLEGVADDVRHVLRRCLEKRRELRWQRMGAVVIELKLARAAARQARQAAEWKQKAAATQAAQEAALDELRETLRRMEEERAADSAGVRQELSGLQKVSEVHARAIESLENAIAQTDEVMEHVVDAFGMAQRPLVEREESAATSRNGN